MVQRKHTRGRRNNRRSRRGGYELESPVEGQPLMSSSAPKPSLGEETKKVGEAAKGALGSAFGALTGLFSTSGDENVHSPSETSSTSPETGSLIGGRRIRKHTRKHTRKHRKGRKHNKSKRAHRRTSRRNGRSRQHRHRRR